MGYQAFRIPVELVLWLLHRAGAIPVQLTFEGRNLDVLSGVLALLVAWRAARNRLSTVELVIWNVLGLVLLVNIVGLSILSESFNQKRAT